MASKTVNKNIPTLTKWVSTIQKHMEVINKTTGELKMCKVRCFYFYLRNTHQVWRDQKSFVKVMRAKTHEFWHEPAVRPEMEAMIKEYKWKTCGHPTKSGKPCKKYINFGDASCCIHNPNSNWTWVQAMKRPEPAAVQPQEAAGFEPKEGKYPETEATEPGPARTETPLEEGARLLINQERYNLGLPPIRSPKSSTRTLAFKVSGGGFAVSRTPRPDEFEW